MLITTALISLSRLLPRCGGRLFFIPLAAVLLSSPAPLSGQFKFREPPSRQTPTSLQRTNYESLLDDFRNNRAIGRFSLQGELTHRPSKAASVTFDFLMQGNWLSAMEFTALSLRPVSGDGLPVLREVTITGKSVILSSPDQPSAASIDNLNTPVLDGFPVQWFDILMPWLRWPDVSYIGPERYLGRPAHRFQFNNPNPDDGDIHYVRVSIDEDFAALLKADFFNPDGEVKKRLRIGGFRKFDDVWMVSEMTWENRISRDSIKLRVADFNLINQAPMQ